jgi:hypothetical protein
VTIAPLAVSDCREVEPDAVAYQRNPLPTNTHRPIRNIVDERLPWGLAFVLEIAIRAVVSTVMDKPKIVTMMVVALVSAGVSEPTSSMSAIEPMMNTPTTTTTIPRAVVFKGLNDTFLSTGNTIASSRRNVDARRIEIKEALEIVDAAPTFDESIIGYSGPVIIATNTDAMASRNRAAAFDLGDFIQPSKPAPRHIAPAPRDAAHV